MYILEKPPKVQVFGDRDRIGQVLINLLTNAMKYSPDADTVIVRIAIDGGNVLLSVQDFGIGIAEAYQKKIFEQFYQVNEPAEKTYPGLGIGLYIACKIIERHQGKLWVQSRKGEGATFSFCLPLLDSEY
jgi:signal transduction histidine kinase